MSCCHNVLAFIIGIFISFRVLRIILPMKAAIYYHKFWPEFNLVSNKKHWLKKRVVFTSSLKTVQSNIFSSLMEFLSPGLPIFQLYGYLWHSSFSQ